MSATPSESKQPRRESLPGGAGSSEGPGALDLETRWEVPSELVGERLDKALVELLGGVSRSRIQELIGDGGVYVGDAVETRTSRAMESGDVVRVVPVTRSRERRGAPEGARFLVRFEDEHIAVISKPTGMVAHPSSVVRGGTVSELALEQYGELPDVQGEGRPGIVHRLDAETSGLMVIAKSRAGGEGMVELFRERKVEKTYVAVVHFEPRFDSDWIEAPIGRAEKRSDRMTVVPEGEGREAQTFYETKLRSRGFAFMIARPRTGRTHQIRVHLSSIDHPLVGDPLYTGRRGLKLSIPKEAPKPERTLLHSRAIAFDHPVSGERVEVEEELPADVAAFLAWMRE